jgi:aminomuconate-semialdehyde/2-hydroxymuconate-6-semialdehyde dehydrogenase
VVKNVPAESFQMATPTAAARSTTRPRAQGRDRVISPWNAPFLLMTWKVGPALACGNTVVVKPSEESPHRHPAGRGDERGGHPQGRLQRGAGLRAGFGRRVPDPPPGVDAITFTGETRTGAAIMKAASDGMRDVSFELGGKNAGIVFADADFDAAVDGIFRSAFLNTGQVCLGTERVYVERPIFERFVQALKAKAEAVKYGRPTTTAPTTAR